MQNPEAMFQITQIIKDYPGVRAVDHANIDLLPGEVHALVGENGAGKSTLVKIMAGVVQPDTGQMILNQEPVQFKNGQDAYKAGFSFIHQELNLIPFMNAPENVFLGHSYPKNQVGLIGWKTLAKKTKDIFDALGVEIKTNVPVGQLLPGEQSMVAIARAFALDARIYVMDEPTASLSNREVESLFNVIQTLKAQGKTVLYISHRLEEIFQISDRVTIMRDGSTVGTFITSDLDKKSLINHMIGKDLNQYYPPATSQPGNVIFEVKNAGSEHVKNINFKLKAGEVLGIAGLIGSGRSELLHMLYGLDSIKNGELVLYGNTFQPSAPSASIRERVVLVPEERRTQGLVMNHSITENIVMPHLKKLTRANLFTSKAKEKQVSKKVSENVRLKAASIDHAVSTLSGGNQQKVVFARWMVDDVNVLLLDEPTRGVDVGARFEIYSLIRDMATKGTGILLVSSDLQEIIGLSDRIIVMREGSMVAELDNVDLTKFDILKHAYKAA
jgi:ribose transport system ATP-binding protein